MYFEIEFRDVDDRQDKLSKKFIQLVFACSSLVSLNLGGTRLETHTSYEFPDFADSFDAPFSTRCKH